MSISYPIQFIDQAPATERLTLSRRQSVTESPFTYSVQVVQTASQWQLAWTWARMRPGNAELVDAWILSLRGQEGSFRYCPRQAFPSSLTGKTVAQDAYAYNTTLRAGGWTANAPSTLCAGQWFQVGDQLLRITDASSLADGSGQITVNFEPALRITYGAGSVINFVNPSGVFRLNASEGLGSTLDVDRAPEFSAMAAREVI